MEQLLAMDPTQELMEVKVAVVHLVPSILVVGVVVPQEQVSMLVAHRAEMAVMVELDLLVQ